MRSRNGFSGPFLDSELPKPIPSDIMQLLVQRLRNGDERVREIIIEGHMRLAVSIVSKFSHRYYYYVDDMVSAAMVGLCQAVDWAPTRLYDNNITPYIYQTCERFIREAIENRLSIQVPRKTFLTIQEEQDRFVSLVQSIDKFKQDEDNPIDYYDQLSELEAKTVEDNPVLFQELLESLQLTPRDKTIVDLLMSGYDQTEIGELIGLTRSGVSWIKKQLAERLEAYLKQVEQECALTKVAIKALGEPDAQGIH